MVRRKLPVRRANRSIKFEHDGQHYHATIGYYAEGTPGELFLNSSGRAGSMTDMASSEAAIAISLAIQHGCPIADLVEACLRNSDGSPSTPIGKALDIMVEDQNIPSKPRKRVEL
jgi:hypothetical protein